MLHGRGNIGIGEGPTNELGGATEIATIIFLEE